MRTVDHGVWFGKWTKESIVELFDGDQWRVMVPNSQAGDGFSPQPKGHVVGRHLPGSVSVLPWDCTDGFSVLLPFAILPQGGAPHVANSTHNHGNYM